MTIEIDLFKTDFDPRFKIFHELMPKKIRDILLISTPYDAWIMEEDCRLSERITQEYRGLNLSHPPLLTWVSSADEALSALEKKKFDMVIAMQRFADMDAFAMGQKIKSKVPEIPVMLLSHRPLTSETCYPGQKPPGIDRTFLWGGNTDILVALIKNAEDWMNVIHDTCFAGIRVLLFVEDSPAYISSLLPILYRELVIQTQSLIEEGLNQEHRLLTMRARPKILLAETYEEATDIYEQFSDNISGIISDVSFSRNCKLDHHAGIELLSMIKKERWDIPMLLTSSEPSNSEKAAAIPVAFVDKNSPCLHAEIRSFFLNHLGFGDFIFRMPDGEEIARAANLRALEEHLRRIPDQSFVFHCNRNDFSRWLFARSEIVLASRLRPIRDNDFSSVESHRQYLISLIHERRRRRQKGVVVNFDTAHFDLDTEFFKIGSGSLGGKARGLAFLSSLLHRNPDLGKKFDKMEITIPQTLVITTEGFDAFIEKNNLRPLSKTDLPDAEIAEKFVNAEFPKSVEDALRFYLSRIKYPLAVRSSSLLEDAQFRAYAGLYHTYMLSNDHPDTETNLKHLIHAVKLVYASTYFQGPKAFARRVGHRTEEEKMAVIIQQMVGKTCGDYFYPAVSGIAQSHNYYPFSHMKPEDGIVNIALGLGRTVMEGDKSLRFCPAYPQLLPQYSSVEDILKNTQQFFYALKMKTSFPESRIDETATLEKREVNDAAEEPAVKMVAGTYIPDEHRIRDATHIPGYRVLTFAKILKYNLVPLPQILSDVLGLAQEGMGCPVELEFSVNLEQGKDCKPEFVLLQTRPMTARTELMDVDIRDEEISRAFCFSAHALGNGEKNDISDILYVKPDAEPSRTVEIAREIGKMNSELVKEGRKYLLIGPGRWGSADPWLGIPVNWSEISGVGAVVEARSPKFNAEPSQGSHFFHNIITLGIHYVNISEEKGDVLDWERILSLSVAKSLAFVSHVRLDAPITLKADGRKSCCVMYSEDISP